MSIEIADLCIKVDSAVDLKKFEDIAFCKNFIKQDKGHCHCRLDLKIGRPPAFDRHSNAFDPMGNWQLSSIDGQNVLRIGPPTKGENSRDAAVFNADYTKGAIYRKHVYAVFGGFIDQFILINILSRKSGFLLHASGVVWEGKGLCFIGPSGAGKSTLLKLFSQEVKKEHLLNDDRLAMRRCKNKWRVFGTPWHGELPFTSPAGADLKALFFIAQSKNNYARKLSPGDVCGRLSVFSILPVWNAEATSRVLTTFQSLIKDVPAYELGFLPDRSAVELIKNTIR